MFLHLTSIFRRAVLRFRLFETDTVVITEQEATKKSSHPTYLYVDMDNVIGQLVARPRSSDHIFGNSSF